MLRSPACTPLHELALEPDPIPPLALVSLQAATAESKNWSRPNGSPLDPGPPFSSPSFIRKLKKKEDNRYKICGDIA